MIDVFQLINLWHKCVWQFINLLEKLLRLLVCRFVVTSVAFTLYCQPQQKKTTLKYAEMPRVSLWQMIFEKNYLKNDKFLERKYFPTFMQAALIYMKMLKNSCRVCKIFHKLNEFILSALKSWNACRIKSLCYVATTMKQPSVHAIANYALQNLY